MARQSLEAYQVDLPCVDDGYIDPVEAAKIIDNCLKNSWVDKLHIDAPGLDIAAPTPTAPPPHSNKPSAEASRVRPAAPVRSPTRKTHGRGVYLVDFRDISEWAPIARKMIGLGPPTLRALWHAGKVILLEGSHRAHAAAYLGYDLRIEFVRRPDESIDIRDDWTRCADLLVERREGDYICGCVRQLVRPWRIGPDSDLYLDVPWRRKELPWRP